MAGAKTPELGILPEVNNNPADMEPALKPQSEVLIIRVEIYRTLEKWEHMETVARRLSVYQQDEMQSVEGQVGTAGKILK